MDKCTLSIKQADDAKAWNLVMTVDDTVTAIRRFPTYDEARVAYGACLTEMWECAFDTGCVE